MIATVTSAKLVQQDKQLRFIQTMTSSVSKKNHMTNNMEFIMRLGKFVPSLVIQQLIKRDCSGVPNKLPELQAMETVVLWADISGFTNLSEACAAKGPRGNEELAFCINRYMEGMITNLDKYGGDIIKFVGDAMIVMWPPIDKEAMNWELLKVDTIRRAIQCSQDMQRTMHNLQVLPGIKLSVKIGIGYGKCAILYVGGVFNRNESFTVGEALSDALKSEGLATSGGQTIVAASCFLQVQEYFRAKKLDGEDAKEFYLVDNMYNKQRVKISSEAMRMRSQFSMDVLNKIQRQMQGSVAHCIVPFLQIDQEIFGSENQSLTVMFVNLGVDLSSAETQEGMDKIHRIMIEIQQQIYRLQGSLNKLVMDDKGSTLICLWGLLPFAHQNDAARALLTGFNIIKALTAKEGVYCNIGVSSGECFAGVVGTSGSRKEFSVLGDIVNLAARIVGFIKGSNSKNIMMCDLNTRMLAQDTFDFVYKGHKELKGKSISIPFFEPIDTEIKLSHATQRKVGPDYYLNVHQSPMILERNQKIKYKIRTTGFSELLDQMVEEIVEFFDENHEPEFPHLTIMKGTTGSGKTAFAKHLIGLLHQRSEFEGYIQSHGGDLPVFTSSINPESQLHFLGAWRTIIQSMLFYFCDILGKKIDNFLAECVLKAGRENLSDLIFDIAGCSKKELTEEYKLKLNVEQVKEEFRPNSFISIPSYEERHRKKVINFFTNVIKTCIYEELDESDWNSEKSDCKTASMHSVNLSDISNKLPVIFVIDNAHEMCSTSWQLLEYIMSNCYRIVIILLVNTDTRDRILINPGSIEAFEEAHISIQREQFIATHDLPRLKWEEIGQVIALNAPLYRESFKNEINDMVAIIDRFDTIKTKEASDNWKDKLTEKWQINRTIRKVDREILMVITEKCHGNPLICLQYFVNMLHNDLIRVENTGFVIPTDNFFHCKLINDWTIVPCPRIAAKIRLQRNSQFLYQIHSKGKNCRPGEAQEATLAIVLMKVASVLGIDFELQALQRIAPLPNTEHSNRLVKVCISLLEHHDMIEMVDMKENNAFYRFNKLLSRETTYQTARYKGCKKELHRDYADYMPAQEELFMGENTLQTEKLKRHMLLAQDCEEEKDLPQERRTTLVVLRIHNRIFKYPNKPIFKDVLTKEGYIYNQRSSKKVVILSQQGIKWYNEDPKEIAEDAFKGYVQLPFIYSNEKSFVAKGSDGYAFQLSVSMHQDKTRNEAGRREIVFVAKTEQERDKWMAAIDYLKTRAIYDQYAKKNHMIHFVKTANKDLKQGEENGNERDTCELLYNFGDKLKAASHSSSMSGAQIALNQSSRRITSFASSQPLRRQSSTVSGGFSYTSGGGGIGVFEQQASQLAPKLKLLYQVGMTALIHHLNSRHMEKRNEIAVTLGRSKVEPVGLPYDLEWNIDEQVETISNQTKDLALAHQKSQNMSGVPRRESLSAVFGQTQKLNKSQLSALAGFRRTKNSIGVQHAYKQQNNKGGRRVSTRSAEVRHGCKSKTLPKETNLIEEEQEESSESSLGEEDEKDPSLHLSDSPNRFNKSQKTPVGGDQISQQRKSASEIPLGLLTINNLRSSDTLQNEAILACQLSEQKDQIKRLTDQLSSFQNQISSQLSQIAANASTFSPVMSQKRQNSNQVSMHEIQNCNGNGGGPSLETPRMRENNSQLLHNSSVLLHKDTPNWQGHPHGRLRQEDGFTPAVVREKRISLSNQINLSKEDIEEATDYDYEEEQKQTVEDVEERFANIHVSGQEIRLKELRSLDKVSGIYQQRGGRSSAGNSELSILDALGGTESKLLQGSEERKVSGNQKQFTEESENDSLVEVKLSVAPKAFTMVDQKMTFQNILHKKSSESLKTDSAFDED